jgi:hypothetical protein
MDVVTAGYRLSAIRNEEIKSEYVRIITVDLAKRCTNGKGVSKNNGHESVEEFGGPHVIPQHFFCSFLPPPKKYTTTLFNCVSGQYMKRLYT